MPWLRLPKRVHYALKSLCWLARAEKPVRAHELAHRLTIPPAEAAKVLYLLTWAGFVSSRRGSKGGFWLRLPAHNIRVEDVIAFFHPPADHGGKDSNDPVLQVWQDTAAPSHRAFAQLTLADLLEERKTPHPFRGLASPEGDWAFCP
ncbi:MAG: RrF2 family transcriptional regulator [Terriglobia bacterium]